MRGERGSPRTPILLTHGSNLDQPERFDEAVRAFLGSAFDHAGP